MNTQVHGDRVSARCAALGAGWVDVAQAAARARSLCAERGYAVERAARCAVTEGLLADGGAAHHRRLVELWHPVVVRWCRAGAGPRVVAEDAAQDALVRLYEQLPRIREPRQIQSFVWGLVWRVLREHERVPAVVRWVLGTLPDVEARGASGESQLLHDERLAQVHVVLRQMALQDREMLWLVYAEGLRRREAARLLGMAEGTMNRKLTRARARFEKLARRAGMAPLTRQKEGHGG